jgi:hypothetical protein
MPRSLDFIVIGAAKSATTTLYELVKNHPEISIPTSKEVPFFSDDRVFNKGLQWYIDTYFRNATKGQRRGTITPQYMIGEGVVTSDEVAERIHNTLPNVKLVAVVRHPIQRAFSHYRMLKKRGYETRTFEQAAEDNLKGRTKIPNYDEPDSNYIGCSEYGRILKRYYDLFPKKNILIITTDELRENPSAVIEHFFSFINIDTSYTPPDITVRSRKGGSKPRTKYLTPGFIFSVPLIKTVWQNHTPQFIRRRVEYTINLWNTQPDDEKLDTSTATYKKLVRHYKNDLKKFVTMTKKNPPWKELNVKE